MDNASALEVSTYDARRLLPTIGGLLHFSPEERAALGNWRDHTADPVVRKAAANMGVHYDASVLIQTAQAKSMAIEAVRIACSKVGSFEIPFDELPLSLPALASLNTAKAEAGLGIRITKEVEPSRPPSGSSRVFPVKPLAAQEKSDLSGSQSSSSESESVTDAPPSDSELSQADAESYIEVCAAYQTNLWVVPVASAKGKEVGIHSVLDETPEAYVTECGKKVGLSAERLTGWGNVLLSPNSWCRNCRSKLPLVLRSSLVECSM